MIVLLDTNILVRGSISQGTAVATIIDAWLDGSFTLVVSTHILDEVARTVRKPHFASRLGVHGAANYQHQLSSLATLVPITAQVQRVATHPEDDLILATAVSAGADFW